MTEKSFVSGILVGLSLSCIYFAISSRNSDSQRGEAIHGDDDCHSLFYAAETHPDGSGMTITKRNVEDKQKKNLCTVQPEYIRLPFELYKQAVEKLPICCVDVMLQRKSDKKILLFYRRDKPANNIWWWPGGRMFRGETFYDCAGLLAYSLYFLFEIIHLLSFIIIYQFEKLEMKQATKI